MNNTARSYVPIQNTNDILADLNEQQLQAVMHNTGALLVLSGAGTGKTKVITTKIAYLLNNFYAAADQILAMTFSNKAAMEMHTRIRSLTTIAEGIWVGTFHAISAKILRRHAELVGLTNDFTILDVDDQTKLAKQILVDQNRDRKLAGSIINKITLWKDRCIPIAENPEFTEEDVIFYKKYQEMMLSYNAVDFSDLIIYVITIFRDNAEILKKYRNKFEHILVDEYQDTNTLQYTLLRQLCPAGNGLCCVGDDDQSIYSWRGAEIANILRFEKDFHNSSILKLEQNYRSCRHILSAANGLIAHNSHRHGKQLWTTNEEGSKVTITRLHSGFEEAVYVAKQISILRMQKVSTIAVLVRAGYQTREFEDVFLQANIPYRVIGGPKFYERSEIKDVLAYMRLVHQNSDNLAFERVINVPKRGLGDVILRKLREIALLNSCSLYDAAEYVISHSLVRASAKTSLSSFIKMVNDWKKSSYTPATLAKIIVEDSGYLDLLQKDKNADSRKENINELIAALEEYNDLGEFLEHVSIATHNMVDNSELVNVMTIHSSKGLEFDAVFLCGFEDGVFPNNLSLRDGTLEEERRLAYVGITRAKSVLSITYASNRNVHGQWQSNPPSRFLRELPSENIDYILS